jgi:DNA-3-methyladenine glycosylase I
MTYVNNLMDIFELIVITVNSQSDHGLTSLPGAFALCDAGVTSKHFENASDDDYFQEMAHVVFASGLTSRVATGRIPALDDNFSHYAPVAEYDEASVRRLSQHPDMLKHDRKMRRLISVAKSFRSIIGEHRSFANYLDTFGGRDIESALGVRAHLMNHFVFLGRFTSLIFLREIGYPILKIDHSVMNVFCRLGLINGFSEQQRVMQHVPVHEPQLVAALKVGAQLAAASGQPIEYIDMILSAFAKGSTPEAHVMTGGCL